MTGIKYQTKRCRESAEQWRDRERESMCVRDLALLEMKDSVNNKIDH